MMCLKQVLSVFTGAAPQQQQPVVQAAEPAPAAAAPVKLKPKSLLSAAGAGDTSAALTSAGTAYGKQTLGA